MSEKNGGPAFPINSPSGTPEYMPARDGMSLRDYFAGQALAGMLANNRVFEGCVGRATSENITTDHAVAIGAYELADALLKARTQGE